jgi:predicted dithiol-disulfide oxidoreductase (DUF899 family)
MFTPEWDEGCPHCSFWADNFNEIIVARVIGIAVIAAGAIVAFV